MEKKNLRPIYVAVTGFMIFLAAISESKLNIFAAFQPPSVSCVDNALARLTAYNTPIGHLQQLNESYYLLSRDGVWIQLGHCGNSSVRETLQQAYAMYGEKTLVRVVGGTQDGYTIIYANEGNDP